MGSHLDAFRLSPPSLHVGCGQSEGRTDVQVAVAKFRESMAAENYHAIYGESSPKSREKTTGDFYTRYSSAIDRKLGNYLSSKVAGSTFKCTLRVPRWVVVYKSTFERGEATERFRFARGDGQIKLLDYNIDTLVINVTGLTSPGQARLGRLCGTQ